MTVRRPASWALLLYYLFLLLTTASTYGSPYPLFAWLLEPPAAKAAVVADCLALVHIVVGVTKGQRLTWYLLLGYNAFMLASLGVSLAAIPAEQLLPAVSAPGPAGEFYAACGVAAAAMAAVTVLAVRLRPAFADPDPFLF